MKKTLVFFALLILSTSFLCADMNLFEFAMSSGYSNISNSPSFGFNSSYTYLANIDNTFYLGIDTHGDFNMQFTEDETNISCGLITGPSFAITPNTSTLMAVTLGPAIFVENGEINSGASYSYSGMGLGADISGTFFFGSSKALGITLGATSYMLFGPIEKGYKSGFTYDIVGYFGFTYRGDYWLPLSITYDIF